MENIVPDFEPYITNPSDEWDELPADEIPYPYDI